MGRLLIILGLLIALLGLLVSWGVPLFRLPGDLVVRRGNWSFYFPIVTSLVLSLLLTLVFMIFRR